MLSPIEISKIKLVIWDLDETFWQGTLSEEGISEIPENSQLVINMASSGVISSICSKNDEGPTINRLSDMGISDYFVFKSINWDSKGLRCNNIIKEMGLRPQNVLFIDDNISNLNEVKFYCEGIAAELPENIIPSLIEFFSVKEGEDKKFVRLNQYKILEKKYIAKKGSNSNEEFLYASNIKVSIHNDCNNNIERIHELISRSNQLNFTKNRDYLNELRSKINNKRISTGYVSVSDNYGEYGIVGFYAFDKDNVYHFVFSCRTIGLGIEQYIFNKLKIPQFKIAEPVVSEIFNTNIPEWINNKKDINGLDQSDMSFNSSKEIKILMKGPCDMSSVLRYLKNHEDYIETEYSYVDDKTGFFIEHHNHSTNIINNLKNDKFINNELNEDCIFNTDSFFKSKITNVYDVLVLSSLIEANLGIYKNKEYGFKTAFGEAAFSLCDEKNWDGYINGDIYNANVKFTREWLEKFASKYEYIGNIKPSQYVKNIEYIHKHLGGKTLIFVTAGSELKYNGDTTLGYKDRHVTHKEFNHELQKLAKKNEQIKILDYNQCIVGHEDYTNNINHFTSTVYFTSKNGRRCGRIELDPTKQPNFHMPISLAKTTLWFLSPILKLLGGWKMLLIILIKAIAVVGWRRGWVKKLAKRFLTKG